MTTQTMTQPKIQKLESREDLELLVSGDVVLINKSESQSPTEALYYGKNYEQEFIFLVRENDHQIKRVVVPKEHTRLSEDGLLIVKPVREFTDWKDDYGAYDLLNDKLVEARI